jgi:predicted flap endonuclease-1-like 5' DNA nuclease
MPSHFHERWEGSIRGLRLPIVVWNSLRDEGITTLDQLKAVADRLEQIVGIGSKLAQVIREELANLAAAEQQPSDKV